MSVPTDHALGPGSREPDCLACFPVFRPCSTSPPGLSPSYVQRSPTLDGAATKISTSPRRSTGEPAQVAARSKFGSRTENTCGTISTNQTSAACFHRDAQARRPTSDARGCHPDDSFTGSPGGFSFSAASGAANMDSADLLIEVLS